MTYPARPVSQSPSLRSTLRPTRWLALGLCSLGFGPACSDDASTNEDIDAPTTTTMGPTTASITTASATAATSGGVASTTGNVAASTTGGMSSASVSTTGRASTTGAAATTATSGGTTSSTGEGGGTSTGTDTSTGSGGSGGTGGGATFQPCPETPPCKVLPLGDSITFGLGFDGGYRVELFHLALEGGHEITFTGTQQPNGPSMVDGVTFPRNHAGISGQLIAEIGNRIPNPDMMDMPHIVLVHAGTNDMVRSRQGAEGREEALIDKLIATAPDALIVVSNLIPLRGNGDIEVYNAAIPPMVEERASAGAHIIFADQFTGFPDSELGDGVHPNQAGYNRMAGVWYEAIEPYLR